MTSLQSPPSTALMHLSPEAAQLKEVLERFVREECVPAEKEYDAHVAQFSGAARWTAEAVPPCLGRLQRRAQALGLWNLFLPRPLPDFVSQMCQPYVAPALYLGNREYGILCETMGRSFLAPEACNCSAPDTGNMEVLLKHGTKAQQKRYLKPLLEGTCRSTFLMTEPDVASSDATNIQTQLIKQTGTSQYLLSGRKWWSTGAMDPRCKIALVLCKLQHSSHDALETTTGRHGAHTVVVMPMQSKGVQCVRPLTVFGYDDAPHGHAEVRLEQVQLDASHLIIGESKGFEVAQSRLGPGRIHHCMRAVGLAARCLELLLERVTDPHRNTFGTEQGMWQHSAVLEQVADSVIDLECARLLTLQCAHLMDQVGARSARDAIAGIKVRVPELCINIVDRAIQIHGGAGVSGDFILARALANLRTLRIADGPDAVHKRTIGLLHVKKQLKQMQKSKQSRL
uniref:Acyl-CoA dehydrogenase n=1 Tax=Attheya septentrionalis TaxID=420275 RepID=A0A7S2U6D4_9STRA|mmetsp:Transcript_12351/g.22420  ORF Transcript_12351/g.22420 Transcript_12351/m.22420 type:complete len:455 (+) Transcript_12351:138-1502(+)